MRIRSARRLARATAAAAAASAPRSLVASAAATATARVEAFDRVNTTPTADLGSGTSSAGTVSEAVSIGEHLSAQSRSVAEHGQVEARSR